MRPLASGQESVREVERTLEHEQGHGAPVQWKPDYLSHHRPPQPAVQDDLSRGLVNRLLICESAGAPDPEGIARCVQGLLFASLPCENVTDLTITPLSNEVLRQRFLDFIRREGTGVRGVRVVWHLAGSVAAANAIELYGICCAEGHCACGRYGNGGYVASTAAKANAYAALASQRELFAVLALPGPEIVCGVRGKRPSCTAADLPSHPTEYCFVEEERLHCFCRVSYEWVPTGRRSKVATASPTPPAPGRSPRV